MKNTTKNYIIRAVFLILVVIWMITVFKFSNQPADESDKTSSGTTKILVEFFWKNKSITEKENLIEKIDPIVRKFAHFTIFLIGGFLIHNYVSTFAITEKKKVAYSTIIGTLYACTDEFHQLFVEGRAGQIKDIYIDSLGVLTGICIFLCIKLSFEGLKKKMYNKET